MKKILRKNIWREFQFSFSRFLSVTILLALGVFVLVGLKSTGTDMRLTANQYYQQHHLADAQLTSNLPLTKSDQNKIQNQLKKHHGQSFSVAEQQDSIIAHSQDVIRLQNLTTNVSQAKLVKGHFPHHENEIVLNVQDQNHYKIGDWLKLEKKNSHNLKHQNLKIVGFVTSSDYLDKSQLGTTTLKNGRVNTFGYLKQSAFKKFHPTIIKLNFNNVNRQAYNDTYERQIQKNVDQLQHSMNTLAKDKNQQLQRHWQNIYQQKALQLQQLLQFNSPVLNQQIIQGQNQLQQLKNKIKQIPPVEYTIQTRSDYNYGYNTFGEEAKRIDILSNVFPYVFFIVALIVCFTTMSRMASEKREELGLLTGLGYSHFDAIKVFLVYGSLSGLLGAAIGAYLGSTFLTTKIYEAYSANYALPSLTIQPVWTWILVASVIAFSVAVLPALSVALQELKSEPAILLQPTVPTKGGKILLEKLTWVWKKISFKYQVTFRNIFRYKTRMLMTIIGIFGCTALLITGFGIRDSLTGIVKTQYQQLIHYDEVNIFKPGVTTTQKNNYLQKIKKHNNVKQAQLINYQSMYVRGKQNINNQEVTLLAASNFQQLNKFVSLKTINEQPIESKTLQGIVVTQKLAESMHLKVGDYLKFENKIGQQYQARIGAISKMYAGHFIFMTAAQYQHILGQQFIANSLIVNNKQRSSQKINHLSTWLNRQPETLTIIRSDTIKDAINYILDGLNNLIFIIIICSSLLALVVLYTLTNINVSERLRELATMKVIGFYQSEVVMSIFRETIFLTIGGIILGFGGGYLLHHYIMQTLPPQNVMVSMYLRNSNFLISTIMTLIFAIFVMIIMSQKIKKIDMLAALKAVD